MKYKIGDKVKYDGGDWWFYGTVSAVFEHSISPCYRLSVERMEKKSCKFSITQFEFELETDEVESDKDKRNWEHSEIEVLKKYYGLLNIEDLSKMLKRSPWEIVEKWRQIKPEAKPEPQKLPSQKPEQKTQKPEQKEELGTEKTKTILKRKTTDAWDKNLESYRQGKKSSLLNVWKSKNRKEYKAGILAKDKYEKLIAINFPFEVDKQYLPTTGKTKREKVELTPIQKEPSKRKISDVWERNLVEYLNGKKSFAVYNWITSNRKQYQTGTLSEEKYERLKQINGQFSFVWICILNH